MSCKHGPGLDPNCSSYPARVAFFRRQLATVDKPNTPDSRNFEIEAAQPVGPHMVLKVKYPNCEKCAYEGTKVLVFLNCSALDVVYWKEIDPHFRAEPVAPKAAPSPDARFPASPEGWDDALRYASWRVNK